MLRIRLRPALIVSGIVAVLLIVGSILFFIHIDRERNRLADLDRIVVDEEVLVPPNAVGVTLWLAEEPPVDVEPFGGRVYAATSAGLVAYDTNGRMLERYTTLEGLPENSLTCLERYGDRLFIGTSSSGLVSFDGERFVGYRFRRPEASRVSCLRAVQGELLVGTFDAGLFEYDGATFTRRYQRDLGPSCRRITSVRDDGPRLLVGTYDEGLFLWREGTASRIDRIAGLPSNRITGIVMWGSTPVVATDVGTAEIRSDETVEVIDRTPNATGIVVSGGTPWVASLTGGVRAIGTGSPRPVMMPIADRGEGAERSSSLRMSRDATILGLKQEDDAVWALTSEGMLASTSTNGELKFETFVSLGRSASGLSAGHVSALGFDRAGRLWAGQFDGGLDIIDASTGARLEHIADQAFVEVNGIVPDPDRDRMWVATSKSVGVFEGVRRSHMLGDREGLLDGNVAGLALAQDGSSTAAIATSRGVSFYDGTTARSLTAFHGLPNNHAYAIATIGSRTFVGTLGGLAEISALRVDRVFSTSDSNLPHNWVNALAVADGRLYIGTYGGGVATLLPTGEIAVAEETAGLEINPGAMAVVGRRLYAGTLGKGAYALDLDTGVWTRISAVLSSTNVTSIAANEQYVYFGTEHGITRVDRSALL